jgi:HlyD family secretion protein
VLALVIAAFVALPLVHVSVSVASEGIVRPVLDKQLLRARASAVIREVRVANNQSVRANDTLVVLDDRQHRAKARVLQEQLAERESLIGDFESLLQGAATAFDSVMLQTPVGYSEKSRFLAERHRLQLIMNEATRQQDLTRALGRTPGIVTVDELRRRESEAAQAESDWSVQRERSVAEWSARIRSERDNVRDLRSQLADLDLQRSLFVLLSPVDGTAEQVISMSPGGFVQSGDELLQISPETRIAAEIQVSARDIGMLALGMPVRMMIDAFDYNSWGVATGRIVSIARDATMIERQAIFSVRCSIDQSDMSLKSGYRGRIQKGMTLHARFLIAAGHSSTSCMIGSMRGSIPTAHPGCSTKGSLAKARASQADERRYSNEEWRRLLRFTDIVPLRVQ